MVLILFVIVEIGVAGSMAGSVMAFLNCPIELLKVKLQTQDPKGVIGANGKLEPAVSIIFPVKNECLLIFLFSLRVLLIVVFVPFALKDSWVFTVVWELHC